MASVEGTTLCANALRQFSQRSDHRDICTPALLKLHRCVGVDIPGRLYSRADDSHRKASKPLTEGDA
jgi:hypothetical protein